MENKLPLTLEIRRIQEDIDCLKEYQAQLKNSVTSMLTQLVDNIETAIENEQNLIILVDESTRGIGKTKVLKSFGKRNSMPHEYDVDVILLDEDTTLDKIINIASQRGRRRVIIGLCNKSILTFQELKKLQDMNFTITTIGEGE